MGFVGLFELKLWLKIIFVLGIFAEGNDDRYELYLFCSELRLNVWGLDELLYVDGLILYLRLYLLWSYPTVVSFVLRLVVREVVD